MILRLIALTRFLLRDFLRSLASFCVLVLLMGLYQMGFYFGGDQRYFAAVGGAEMILVCVVTTVLLCWQVDRARTYPLLARLPRRGELLLAVLISAYLMTLLYALLFALLVISTGKVTPVTWAIFAVGARWLLLFFLFTALALHISRLIRRAGSHILALGILAFFVTGLSALEFSNNSGALTWTKVAQWCAWPISILLTGSLLKDGWGVHGLAAGMTLAYSVIFVYAAFWLFRDKDLIWSE